MTVAALLKKKEKVKRFTKVALKHKGNQTLMAKELGITRQAVTKQMHDPAIEKSFLSIMEKAGLTDEEDAKDLARLRKAQKTEFFQKDGKVKDMRQVEDNITQLKALELTCKLKGRVKDGGDTNVQVNVAAFLVPEKKALPQ